MILIPLAEGSRAHRLAFVGSLLLLFILALLGIYASVHGRHELPGLSQDPMAGANQAQSRRHARGMLRENRQAVVLNSGRFDHLISLTEVFTLGGDVEGAAAALSAAAALRPRDPVLLQGSGFVLFGRRQMADAEKVFRQAVAATPGDRRAWTGLGEVLLETDRYPEAIAHFRQALSLDPSTSGVHNSLGITLALARRYDEAIAEFEIALQISPSPVVQANLERARAAKAKE